MSEILKITDPGLLIPTRWLRNMGQEVSIERQGGMLLIEPAGRADARKRMEQAVDVLRQAARDSDITEEAISAEVQAVRAGNARNR